MKILNSIKLTVIFLFFINLTSYAQAQKAPVAPNAIEPAPVKRTAPLQGDFDTDVVTSSNLENIAPAAKTIYTKEQIEHFSASKLQQVNFLCTRSFKIISQSPNCDLDISQIDMNELNKSRQIDKHAVVAMGQGGCSAKIELLSIKEIEAENKKIESGK